MNPGELNRRITILKRSIFTDNNGFETEEWIDYKTVWAKVKNLNGRELFQAQQVHFLLVPLHSPYSDGTQYPAF